jgi:hypothetical protein
MFLNVEAATPALILRSATSARLEGWIGLQSFPLSSFETAANGPPQDEGGGRT